MLEMSNRLRIATTSGTCLRFQMFCINSSTYKMLKNFETLLVSMSEFWTFTKKRKYFNRKYELKLSVYLSNYLDQDGVLVIIDTTTNTLVVFEKFHI